MTEDKENSLYKEEYERIKRNPYDYITGYAEQLYPKTGKRIFEILSLMPPSLILPDLAYDNKFIRSNIHCMFLAPSGAGKSSIAKLFSSFTYNPIDVESITSRALIGMLANGQPLTLIVGDFANMGRDPEIIKVIEGAMEEKRVSHNTMRGDVDAEVECIGLLCGVATDLHFYILGGLIFRVNAFLLGHSSEAHSLIGEQIMSKIGQNTTHSNLQEQIIKDYYNELLEIQDPENKSKLFVKGYDLKEEYKKGLYETWNKMTQTIVNDIGFHWFRELQEGIRFLVAHAFLNVYNRKIENGILIPNEEDYKVAMKLMKKNIVFKYRLMKSESMSKGIRSAKEFNRIMERDDLPDDYKVILKNLVNFKK